MAATYFCCQEQKYLIFQYQIRTNVYEVSWLDPVFLFLFCVNLCLNPDSTTFELMSLCTVVLFEHCTKQGMGALLPSSWGFTLQILASGTDVHIRVSVSHKNYSISQQHVALKCSESMQALLSLFSVLTCFLTC